jgi:hypothetical protein
MRRVEHDLAHLPDLPALCVAHRRADQGAGAVHVLERGAIGCAHALHRSGPAVYLRV